MHKIFFHKPEEEDFFNKSFYVNNVTLLELTDDLGQSLNANNIYKVQLVVTGTGTKTGAEYLVWNDITTTSWKIRGVTLSGNSSNHPLLIVENNVVKVYTKHTSKYTVYAFVEEIISNEDDVQPSIFGASFHWQKDGTTLYNVDGNVGIGTSVPDERLTVRGKIHAQEIKVDMLGALVPDYVFENNYKLRSLNEVENYIQENSHLPEIPSAKEFEKNGVHLAEMNMALLKKVEELTLYAIEQQKSTEKLMKIIEDQNKRLKILEGKK
ncbi:hypothetical protein ASE21_19205 [Flavobacterium sp. Root901]|uniref:tail fiber protein n=1 Tax=Flavobacterium sp. Root901 TaxID=1736605 RepID=UPI00070BDB96|nr:tail fiber protein [Flavobacterium sp. Root901]KRD06301.1 hypothetical protein ASE21_19205 [Flavobacterium sp. Root901]